MRVWTCNDHAGHWVGVASVIVARNREQAEALMRAELSDRGLDAAQTFTVHELSTRVPLVVVLQDGDY